ncbi:hypothetical protein VP01_258g2 [Puccinia sorghi]|uniref:Uncharacterized protein n=1 Tax=Puccinia sorghi TaxID=27349 RepID=A0A0L6V6K1_9BASI|nr:hypothetical protein VP01_258g2 [Puccinia sorghi]
MLWYPPFHHQVSVLLIQPPLLLPMMGRPNLPRGRLGLLLPHLDCFKRILPPCNKPPHIAHSYQIVTAPIPTRSTSLQTQSTPTGYPPCLPALSPLLSSFPLSSSISSLSPCPLYADTFIDKKANMNGSTTPLFSATHLSLSNALESSINDIQAISPSHSISTHEPHTDIVPQPPPLSSPIPLKNSATRNCDPPALFHLSHECSSPPISSETLLVKLCLSTLSSTFDTATKIQNLFTPMMISFVHIPRTSTITSVSLVKINPIQKQKRRRKRRRRNSSLPFNSTSTSPQPLNSPSTPLVLSFPLLQVTPQLAQPLPRVMNSSVQFQQQILKYSENHSKDPRIRIRSPYYPRLPPYSMA